MTCEHLILVALLLVSLTLLMFPSSIRLNVLPKLIATRFQGFVLGPGKWWASSRHLVIITRVCGIATKYWETLICMLHHVGMIPVDDEGIVG